MSQSSYNLETLSDLTKSQLQIILQEKNVAFKAKATKEQLILLIKENHKSKDETIREQTPEKVINESGEY